MFASILLALTLANSAPADSTPQDRRSLEELIEVYEAARDAHLEILRHEVDALLQQLELAIDAGGARKVEAIKKKLVKLGPDVSPLLVRKLEPGANSEVESIRRRSLELSRVLMQFDTLAISDDLIAMARRGSDDAQRNALRVLATTSEPERISPILHELFGKENGPPRDATLGAIAAIGGPDNEAFLGEALDPKDADLASLVLLALAESRSASAAPQVARLLEDASVANRFGMELVAYYSACPDGVDRAVCDAFHRMIIEDRFRAVTSTVYIGLLAQHHGEWSRNVERGLETLAEREDTLGTEARIALALSGSRSAKRDLLEPYDLALDEQPDAASAWAARARIHFRLENYKAATKDYIKALAAKQQRAADRRNEWYEALARSFARMGKLKEASQWIEKSSISMSRRRELGKDPDFKEVAEHARYGKVFRSGS